MNGSPRTTFAQLIQQEGDRATYSAAVEVLAAAVPATPTDLIQLIGVTGKVIRVSMVELSMDATAAGVLDLYLIKRTAANTGGSVSAITPIPHDGQDPAASAVLQVYTALANPLGAGVIIRARGASLPAAGTPAYAVSPTAWDFGIRNGKTITLRGPLDSLCLNFGGQAVPSGLDLWFNIEWSEDVV